MKPDPLAGVAVRGGPTTFWSNSTGADLEPWSPRGNPDAAEVARATRIRASPVRALGLVPDILGR